MSRAPAAPAGLRWGRLGRALWDTHGDARLSPVLHQQPWCGALGEKGDSRGAGAACMALRNLENHVR